MNEPITNTATISAQVDLIIDMSAIQLNYCSA